MTYQKLMMVVTAPAPGPSLALEGGCISPLRLFRGCLAASQMSYMSLAAPQPSDVARATPQRSDEGRAARQTSIMGDAYSCGPLLLVDRREQALVAGTTGASHRSTTYCVARTVAL